MDPSNKSYLLITSAFNEEKYIANTIRSVAKQVLPPVRWIIVDDYSTDDTYNIACSFLQDIPFLQVIRNPLPKTNISLVSLRKRAAIHYAYNMANFSDVEYMGVLDADITFNSYYYQQLIIKFENDSTLGLGGGYVYNFADGVKSPMFTRSENVSGAIQFFRKKCWVDIGGYQPTAYEDSIAIVTAKMKGWTVTSFPDLDALHHKTVGLPGRNSYKAKLHVGRMERLTGDDMFYHFLKCCAAFRERPFIVSSLLRLAGYWSSLFRGEIIMTSSDVLAYMRRNQRKRCIDRLFKR